MQDLNRQTKIERRPAMSTTIILSKEEMKKKEAIDNLKVLKGAVMVHRRYGMIS